MKRIFIIVAGIIVIIGLLVGAYFLFFASDKASLTVGNPFAGTGAGDAVPSGDLPTDGTVQNAGTTIAPKFVKITDGPVAHGSVAFDVQQQSSPATTTPLVSLSATSTASTTIQQAVPAAEADVEVRFIDRASGNVYSYLSHARSLARISNKTLPGIQRVSWMPSGAQAFAQFLGNSGDADGSIQTYAMTADGGEGRLLESGLAQAQMAGSSTVFTLFPGTTGSVGTLSNVDGTGARTLFSSLLSAITVHPSAGNLFANTKPSQQLDGFAFLIRRTDGAFSRILGPYRGLSVLPNQAGTLLLYSYADGTTYRLRMLDVANGTSTDLPVSTLAEKCAWAASGQSVYCGVPTSMTGNLPDSWYQGATTFTDRLWKIDMSDRLATLIVDPYQIGKVNVDAVDLAVDPSEDMLIFTDKHSGALYAYDL